MADNQNADVRSVITLTGLRELDLDPIDTIDGVDEQDQDEDEGDLETVLELRNDWILRDEPGVGHIVSRRLMLEKPGWPAPWGGAGSYVKSFLLTVNGRGMMRTMNRAISDMRRRKTCDGDQSAVSQLPLSRWSLLFLPGCSRESS